MHSGYMQALSYITTLCWVCFRTSFASDSVPFNILPTVKSRYMFGDTLNLTVVITCKETVLKPSVQLHLPESLQWSANVLTSVCKLNCNTNRLLFDSRAVQIEDYSLVKLADANLPNRTKQITLFNETGTVWEVGTNVTVVVAFNNLATDALLQEQAVVAVLTMTNQTSNNQQRVFTESIKQWFHLTPVIVDLYFVAGDRGLNQTKSYLGYPLRFQAEAKIDQRGLPVTLEFLFPRSTAVPDAALVNISSIAATLNNVPLAIQELNSIHATFIVTPGQCSISCAVDVAITLIPNEAEVLRGKVESMDFMFRAKYGETRPGVALTENSGRLTVLLLGPKLDLSVVSDIMGPYAAGQTIQYTATLKHQPTSQGSLVVQKLWLHMPQTSWLTVVPNSLTLRNVTDIYPVDALSLTDTGINIGSLSQGQQATVQVALKLDASVPLGQRISLAFRANYSAADPPSYPCGQGSCQHGGVCINDQCQCSEDFIGQWCDKRRCLSEQWKTYPTMNNIDVCFYQPDDAFLPYQQAATSCSQFESSSTIATMTGQNALPPLSRYWDEARNKSGQRTDIWLGLARNTPQSSWFWANGKPAMNVSWAAGQPTGSGNCASISVSDLYYIRTRDCDEKVDFFCEQRGRNGPGYIFQASFPTTVDVQSITAGDIDLPLSSSLRVHQSVTSKVPLNVPPGTVQGVSLIYEFTLQDPSLVDKFPITFTRSQLTSSSTFVSFASGSLLYLNNSRQFPSRTSTRQRRQADAVVSIVRPIGDVVHNPASGAATLPIFAETTFVLSGNGWNPAAPNFSLALQLSVLNSTITTLTQRDSRFAEPTLLLDKHYAESPSNSGAYQVTARIFHSENSTGAAQDLVFLDDLKWLRFVGAPPSDVAVDGNKLRLSKRSLDVGEEVLLHYDVAALSDMSYNATYLNASLNYSSLAPGEIIYPEYPGKHYGPITVSTCVRREGDLLLSGGVHQHGFSVLAFLLTVLLSLCLALLMISLYYRLKNRKHVLPDSRRMSAVALVPVAGVGNGVHRQTSLDPEQGRTISGIHGDDQNRKGLAKLLGRKPKPLNENTDNLLDALHANSDQDSPQVTDAQEKEVIKQLLAGNSNISAEEERLLLTGAVEAGGRFESNLIRQQLKSDRELRRRKNVLTRTQDSPSQEQMIQAVSDITQGQTKPTQSLLFAEALAAIQLEKARQLTQLRQQEDALLALRSCVLGDLSNANDLSNSECDQLLRKHRQEQRKIAERLDEQKEKQNKEITKRREAAMKQKLEKLQQQLISSSSESVRDVSDCLAKVDDIHNKVLEEGQVRQKLEREMAQELEALRFQSELEKQKLVTAQETQLVKDLVARGNFASGEIYALAKALLPGRSKQELRKFTTSIDGAAGRKKGASKPRSMQLRVHDSVARAQSALYGSAPSKSDKKSEDGKTHPHRLPPIAMRPEPIGAPVELISEYLPPRRLPQLPDSSH